MYGITELGLMVADTVRTSAYSRALERLVTPASVVLDIGTGTGTFALLACRFGARRVYAIESAASIAIAERVAADNGFQSRIRFIEGDSRKVSLPEGVDLVVSDMHGALPQFGTNLACIVDARDRFLAERGRLIPGRETVWAAVVEAAEAHARLLHPWERDRLGLDMGAARHAAVNTPQPARLASKNLLAVPQRWCTLEYSKLERLDQDATLSFIATQNGTAHGVLLWFDCELAEGIAFSTGPEAPELVYGSCLLPWPDAVAVDAGDSVQVRLRAQFTGTDHLWTWDTTITAAATGSVRRFNQSTFWNSPLSSAQRKRRAHEYAPRLGREGQVDGFMLAAFDGETSLESVARRAVDRFPDYFRSYADALARAGDLAARYDERAV